MWNVRCYRQSFNTIQHLISNYVCTLAGRHQSMFPSGQAGLANHWPVFGEVSWCHARLQSVNTHGNQYHTLQSVIRHVNQFHHITVCYCTGKQMSPHYSLSSHMVTNVTTLQSVITNQKSMPITTLETVLKVSAVFISVEGVSCVYSFQLETPQTYFDEFHQFD